MRKRHRSEERHDSWYRQETRTFGGSPEGCPERAVSSTGIQVNESFKQPVLSESKNMPIKECDAQNRITELAATGWNLRESIQVGELASTHRFERMRHLWMLEGQEVWNREAGFDRIEIIAQMHEQYLYAGFDSEPLYAGLYDPKWLHTPEEYTLKMSI